MSLTEIWNNSPDQIRGKLVKQIISFAGNGKLSDGSTGSSEFREYLGLVPTSTLSSYAEECLSARFDDSGFALQDIVNQLGRRLGFNVRDGRYRGISGVVGYDGLWRSPNDYHIVVEVKTSTNFPIELETLANYRKTLIREGVIADETSSILIVVGTEETAELEAQIRGSRHAWDVRLISVEGLKRLVHLKEELDDPATVRRIGEILIPYEYTRVDRIIDLVFSTTEEVLQEESVEAPLPETPSATIEATSWSEPMRFNLACAARVAAHLKQQLIKRSRTLFASPDDAVGVVCLVSKEHSTTAGRNFWYGYHDYQREALKPFQSSYVAFGCGSPDTVILVPTAELETWLPGMNTTSKGSDFYRHVQIFRDGNRFMLHRRKGERRIDITKYILESRA
jgi:hypothetical protein